MNPVLYAEDEVDDIFFMQRAFRQAGVEQALLIVNDGDAVIAYLSGANQYADRRQYPLPALIMLDLNMPRQSGFEVLQWIRNSPAVSRLPVVLISSSGQESDIRQATVLGASAYLVKPGKPAELTQVISALKGYWLSPGGPTAEIGTLTGYRNLMPRTGHH